MKVDKECWLIFLTIVFINFFIVVALSIAVLADETGSEIIDEERLLVMDIAYGGEPISHTQDEIYYCNDSIVVSFPEVMAEEEQIINDEVNNLKQKYPSEEISYYVDEYRMKSLYDGEKFLEYEQTEDNSFTFSPVENDSYRKSAVRFKTIKSYKICHTKGGESKIGKVVDIKYKSNPYQFIFDVQKPEIITNTISGIGSMSDGAVLINNGDNTEFKIKDDSGIKRIELIKNGEIIDEVNLAGEKRIIEYDYTVPLLKEKEDTDTIELRAYDLSSNSNSYSISYFVDMVSPGISMEGIEDGTIAGSSVNIKISVADNSDKENLYYKCMFTDEDGGESCIENLTHSFEGASELVREYVNEGIYDIVTFSYDESGNYSETLKLSFGIDKEAPKVFFENVEDGKVYSSEVSLYAAVKEMFFDKVEASISGTISDDNGERNLDITPYIVEAKLNKNIYTFWKDGKYKIKLKAKDFSNRESEAIIGFTIDKSAPFINVSLTSKEGNEGGMARSDRKDATMICNSSPIIKITTSDKHSEYETNAVLYRKEKDGGYTEVGKTNVVSVGKLADYNVDVPTEGEFLFRVSAKDIAGNVSEKSISFIVDKTPPVIGYIDSFNEKYLKYFTMPKSMKDYIKDMTSVNYKAFLNSKEIDTCEIKKDGKYILQILAEDEAGNTSEEAIAFIVDNTLPKVIVHGIENGGQVKKDEIVKLTLFDEDDYFKSVIVNGENISISDEKEVSVKADKYGEYDISVVAADYAGNEITEEIKMQCALSENPFTVKLDETNIKTLTKNDAQIRESFLENNHMLKYVIICGIIVATAVIFACFSFVDMGKNKS